MSTLFVVPARGGSVAIRRKALRPLGGKPPLLYTLEMAKGLGQLVVVTDDAEIKTLAQSVGVAVMDEPVLATAPGVHTWEPVVWQVVHHYERARGERFAALAVLQCTSPLLQRRTVERCLAALEGYPVALTVKDDRHARIGTQRMPRERMPPCWKVTGGCTAITRNALVETGWPVHLGMPIVVEGAEGVDLDTPEDWAVAEMYAGTTEREALLVRLLGPAQHRGIAVILSAWDEAGEDRHRFRMAAGFTHCLSLHGENTHDEAEKAVAQRSGDDLTIITSGYHMPRAFLTFLQVLHDRGLERTVRLWSAPVPSAWDQLATEWHKITEYQGKGHVASYEQGLAHLAWRDACAT